MALKCELFANDTRLEAAAVSNPDHILRGDAGPHVFKIQKALFFLDSATIDKPELTGNLFGQTTEKAVLAYKQKRAIINRSYQDQADAIVGVMTMASLDKEMVEFESSQDELIVLSAIATVLGYSPSQQHFIVDDNPLRETVRVLQSNIAN